MNSLFADVSRFDSLDITAQLATGLPDFTGFREGFAISLAKLSTMTGDEIESDERALKAAHERWISRLTSTRAGMRPRPARVSLAIASSLVEVLLTSGHVFTFWHKSQTQAGRSMDRLMDFWPEGIASFHYGLSFYGLLILPEPLEPPHKIEDLSLWWSVKENLAEDIGMVAPFLELFAGQTPNWGRFYKPH